MTQLPALMFILGTTTKKTSGSPVFLILLLAVAVLGYFFWLRPQQRKQQAARQGVSTIEVGDEVQTIGGVIGTVLEIHGDRYTLLTGSLGADGNLDGAQPTRIVFIRQAIARKIEPIVDVSDVGDHASVDDDEPVEPEHAGDEEAEEA
jgi:preprotein translocase subunit YajC